MSLLPFRSRRREIAGVTLAVALALVATGCGGSDDGSATSSPPTTADDTLAFTSTSAARSTTTTAPTTTTTEAPVVEPAPLTGGPPPGGGPIDHPALAVKIDNHPNARPQVGLDQADLVFDLRAEGVTRFMAVFHSQIPDEVGPVRSSRTSDFDLVRGLDNPLYASSGGNANVMSGVATLPLYALTNHSRSEYYRDTARPAPHNLFIDPNVLYSIVEGQLTGDDNPSPWFSYRSPDDTLPSDAQPVPGLVTVDFTNSPTVTFEWADAPGGWLRSQDGQPHTNEQGQQLAPENIVILVTTYGTSAADPASPEVRSVGSGRAVVLTDGHVIEGTWDRSAASEPPEILDSTGRPVGLTPGRTWILYPEAGQIDYEVAPAG